MRMYHVSYDKVNQFIPRIPTNRIPGEDSKTPRICYSPTIKQCINAKGGQGSAIYAALTVDLFSLVLFVYSIELDDYGNEDWIDSELLNKKYGVFDAKQTGEIWLLIPPKHVKEQLYIIQNAVTAPVETNAGPSYLVQDISLLPAYIIPEYSWQYQLSKTKFYKNYDTDTILYNLPIDQLISMKHKKLKE